MRTPVYHSPVYDSQSIQAWEKRWFAQQNSSLGLMQQVAWAIAERLDQYIIQNSLSIKKIAVWCGTGNNAGDGYYTAAYLAQKGYQVQIFAASRAESGNLKHAIFYAQHNKVCIEPNFEVQNQFDCHIDALFGIGLNRELDQKWQEIVQHFNQLSGFKVAIDVPSGLQANTGQALPIAIKADLTFTALAIKVGLVTGQAKEYVGRLEVISLIAPDDELKQIAYFTSPQIYLPKRQAFGHKGSYGHVLVVGGHANMGGAVIMAAEAAFHAGAGKVTVICDPSHHTAILSRSPNVMVQDINELNPDKIEKLFRHIDAVCFGMGLGRDHWSAQIFNIWFEILQTQTQLEIVLDADALWFLAEKQSADLNGNIYLTPHSAEAARLLNITAQQVEHDRVAAIYQLQAKYKGSWVLKGSGSLILENDTLFVCSTGNAGMGTGGMGDVLAGMVASLKAQFHTDITLSDIVTLHGKAGDLLAEQGQRGIQAQHMAEVIYQVVNA
ncbi:MULTISPECIES: NAD(P)H-hydrate dehydratase [unclassified Acinetobacter]|uniref:NAD(P)H-hydrate dehydratase n=1 Tax=unclassified Acinetobacter TaxID=196816 RepID=UPI00190DE7C4|nr:MULTISPECIES: NAD(P)H-hydrate dehydratase [unclassified Acinetobacter]MBK0062117.1 NAD(P)H-hydrate dehydratase [Acinetobacter sp. S55]MBK0065921.1 NAD(P)H-hydrate dehydratase [Acinetobacter sp. S54]